MTRKGYNGEYRAKQEAEKIYGKGNVIKIAIAQQGADFMAIDKGRIDLLIEVKETISKKYYPLPQEKNQMQRIIAFAKLHNIKAEMWIYYRKGPGKKTEKEIRTLYNPSI